MTEDKKKKVLWVTDDPWQKSGYGIVGRNVLKLLAADPKYEIHAFGLQHTGGELETKEGYTVHPIYVSKDGFDVLGGYIKQLKPDIVITLRDIGLQAGYVDGINKCKKEGWKGRWYAYCPVDTGCLAHDWKDIFKEMDSIIAMSEWGQKKIKEQAGFDSILIPHGVDCETFKPLGEEARKKKLRGKPYSDTFIIGCNGRNQYRKMWNSLIKGFARFAKGKMDVSLLFHSDIEAAHISDGWSWGYLAYKYDIKNKMNPTFPNMNAGTRFWLSDSNMNEIYNAFNIFAMPTGGEGFGLPILEAQAAGLPVITTAYTTGFELVEGHGEMIPILKDKHGREVMWEGQNGVEFAVPDDIAIAEKLQKLYDSWKGDKKLYNEYVKASREHALKYDWNIIIEKWKKLIDEAPTKL